MDWKWIVLTIQVLLIHSNCDGKELVTQINTKKWMHYVPERFLSMTIDPLTIAAASPLSSESLNMAKGLTPSFVRISGKGTNYLHFGQEFLRNNSTVSEEQFDSVNKFVRDTGLDMIVSLNPTNRLQGVWDSSNSLEMISYANKNGYDAAWQLGYDTQGLNASGGEIGRDIIRLRKILDGFTRYSKSPVFGPDITTVYGDQQLYFLKELLAQAGPILSAIVLSPKMEDYKLGEEYLISKLLDELDTYVWNKEISRNGNLILKKPVWIASIVFTADSAPSKGTFKEAQSLAKKLGSAARFGCQLVLRQPGVNSLKYPTPDFWFSLMYKTLVGRGVLETKIVSGNRTDIHVYSHCTPSVSQDKSILDTDWNYQKGAITIFGVNESPEPFKLTMKASVKEESIHIYSLTTTDSAGLNDETLLNGQLLTLSPSGDLPVLSPKVKKASRISSVTLPAHSIFFIVMPDIKVRSCSVTPLMSPDISDWSKRLKIITESEKTPETSDASDDEQVYVKFSKRKQTESGTRIPRLDQIHSKYRNFAKSLFPLLSVKQPEQEKQEVKEVSSDDLPVKYITFNENSWLNKLKEAVGQMDTMKNEDTKSSEEKFIIGDKAEKYAVLATAIMGADSNYTDNDRTNSRMKRSSTEANPIANMNLNKSNQQKQEELLKELNSYSEDSKAHNAKSNRPQSIFNTLKQIDVTFSNLDNEQLQSHQSKRIRVRQADDESKQTDDAPLTDGTADGNSNKMIESMTKEKQHQTDMTAAVIDENKGNEDDEATIPDRVLFSEAVKDNQNTDRNVNTGMMENINQNVPNHNSEVESADGDESKEKEEDEEKDEKEEIMNEQPLLVQESSEESLEEPTVEMSSAKKQSQVSSNLKSVMEPQAESENKESDLKEVINSENNLKEAINSKNSLKQVINSEIDGKEAINSEKERKPQISFRVNEEILPENQPQTDNENELLTQPRHIQKITPHNQQQKQQFSYPDVEQQNLPTNDELMTSTFINVDNDGQHLMNSKKESVIDSILTDIVNTGDAEYADIPVHPSKEGTVEESKDNNYPLVEVSVPDTMDKVYVPSHPKNNGKQVLDPGDHLMFPTDECNETPKVQRQIKGGPFSKSVKEIVTPNLQEIKVDPKKTPDRSEAMKAYLEGRKERMETLKMKLEQSRKRILEATSKMNLNEEIKSSIKRREVELKNIFNKLDQSGTLEDESSSVKLVAIPVPDEIIVPEEITLNEEIPLPEEMSSSLEGKSRPRRLSKDELNHSYYNNDNKNIPPTFDNLKEEKIYKATKSHNQYLFPLDTKTHGIVYNNKIYPAKLFGVIDVNEDGTPNMNEKWSDISQLDEANNNNYERASGYESQDKSKENTFNPGPNKDNEYSYYNTENSKRKNKDDDFISVVILPPKSKLSVVPMSVNTNKRKRRSASEPTVKESYVNKFNTNQFREQKRSKRKIEEYHPNSLKYQTKNYLNNYKNVSSEKYKFMILKKMEKEGKDLFSLAKKYNELVENPSTSQESINSENVKDIKSTEEDVIAKESNKSEETTIGTCEEIGNSKESIIRDTSVMVTEESNKGDNLTQVNEGSTENPIKNVFASFIVERIKDFLFIIKQATSDWGEKEV